MSNRFTNYVAKHRTEMWSFAEDLLKTDGKKVHLRAFLKDVHGSQVTERYGLSFSNQEEFNLALQSMESIKELSEEEKPEMPRTYIHVELS